MTAGLTGAAGYLRALRVRSMVRQEMARAMEQVDVLVCPTVPRPAPLLGNHATRLGVLCTLRDERS